MSHIIEHLVVGPFMTNVYVFGCEDTREAAIIDGGGNAEGLLGIAEKHDLTITKILQTHAHIDHIAALGALKAETDAPIYMHEADKMLYDAAPQQAAMFGVQIDALPSIDEWLDEGDTVTVGDFEAEIVHLPGHSPGGIAFYFRQIDTIFSGDVLFAGSIGRVDLPGADIPAMKSSLDRLEALPDETRVLSGHGPETTIGAEKKRNPFLLRDWA